MGDDRSNDVRMQNRLERIKRKKKRQQRIRLIKLGLLALAIIIAIVVLICVIKMAVGKIISKPGDTRKKSGAETTTEAVTETELSEEQKVASVIEKADALALTYDYDGAIKAVKASESYSSSEELQKKAEEYQAQKDACVAIPPEEVTHIFYHTLVVDPAKAFVPGEAGYDGWQQWMVTVDEFDKITQSMYDRGYVLVGIHDLVKKTKDESGKVTLEAQNIYLPEGKKAFVLSIDDLSYYHTYDNHGVASRLVLDDEGKPTCEYIDENGKTVCGDYDVVPRMDTFLEKHPDGCYKGARGIIALTGYNGVLGYRTDGTYSDEHNENKDVYYTDYLQEDWLKAHPEYNWDAEIAAAKTVADAMKAEGWEFASHTWGHKNIGETAYDDVVRDTERWLKYVTPVVGETDTIIFAHGADITTSGKYTDDDKTYTYLKSKGFDLFCNVDSEQYTTMVLPDYFHQGRRNMDGYRIYNDSIADESNRYTSDLFNANEILDSKRPLPVPSL